MHCVEWYQQQQQQQQQPSCLLSRTVCRPTTNQVLLLLLRRGRRGSIRVGGAVQLFYFKSVAVVFLMYIAACIHIAKAYLVATTTTRLHAVEHNTTSQPLSLLRGFVALHAEPSK